jgi:hypothetical protein
MGSRRGADQQTLLKSLRWDREIRSLVVDLLHEASDVFSCEVLDAHIVPFMPSCAGRVNGAAPRRPSHLQ